MADRRAHADPDGSARLRESAVAQVRQGIGELRDLAATRITLAG